MLVCLPRESSAREKHHEATWECFSVRFLSELEKYYHRNTNRVESPHRPEQINHSGKARFNCMQLCGIDFVQRNIETGDSEAKNTLMPEDIPAPYKML